MASAIVYASTFFIEVKNDQGMRLVKTTMNQRGNMVYTVYKRHLNSSPIVLLYHLNDTKNIICLIFFTYY